MKLKNETQMQNLLQQVFMLLEEKGKLPNVEVRTFADAMILTNNKGLVVRTKDTEFQLEVTSSPRR